MQQSCDPEASCWRAAKVDCARLNRETSPCYDGSEMVRTKDRVTLSVNPEPPRPLARELPPADPFPIDALGPLLRDAVQAIHDKLQAPLAIGGQSVLGTATLAVQGHADVELPTGQTRPVSSFLIHCGIRRTQEQFKGQRAIASFV